MKFTLQFIERNAKFCVILRLIMASYIVVYSPKYFKNILRLQSIKTAPKNIL